MSAELARLKALRLTIETLERAKPDDPSSPFLGEAVLSRSDVLAAIDLFAQSAAGDIGRAETTEPKEPEVVPLDDPSVPESLVPIPGRATPAAQSQDWSLTDLRIARCIEALVTLTPDSAHIDEVTKEAARIIRTLETELAAVRAPSGEPAGIITLDAWRARWGREVSTLPSTELLDLAIAEFDLIYPARAPSGEGHWQPIETAPERRKVAVSWVNGLGKRRTTYASFWPVGTLDMGDEVSDDDVDENGRNTAAGWWEESEANDDSMWKLTDPLTHWQPLPAPPGSGRAPQPPFFDEHGGRTSKALTEKTRAVMEEIRACSPGRRLAEVPTLFAFGPIYRALAEAYSAAPPGSGDGAS